MGLLSWIVVGLIAGWLAGKVMKGSGFGLGGDIIVGIIGALVGGWLADSVLGLHVGITGFNLSTIIVAFLGSIVVLLVLRILKKK
ncbi:predicted membrane protein [Leptolinea tardivitalis]|nr:GlsB/YeaQ/YmgE family stress response membrane protein [Leptolinea tardivitalis]GAP22367.1 predicted membrane protein [Leptolinea tardivitalis]